LTETAVNLSDSDTPLNWTTEQIEDFISDFFMIHELLTDRFGPDWSSDSADIVPESGGPAAVMENGKWIVGPGGVDVVLRQQIILRVLADGRKDDLAAALKRQSTLQEAKVMADKIRARKAP
jgi:hypothetical protein